MDNKTRKMQMTLKFTSRLSKLSHGPVVGDLWSKLFYNFSGKLFENFESVNL